VNGSKNYKNLSFEQPSYTGKYVYGDFNHDGLKDAAVIVIENSGGNADWYTLIKKVS